MTTKRTKRTNEAYQRDEVIARVAMLIAGARAANAPVVYIQHETDAWPPMNHGAPTWQIVPELAPQPGDVWIYRRAYHF